MAIDSNTIAKFKQTPDATRTTFVETAGRRATPDATYVEKIDTIGEAFGAGIESGAANISAQNQNFLAALDTLKGDDLKARNRIREADFLEDQAGIPLQGLETDFASSLEEGNVHDFMLNFASATGQFIPSLAASLAEAVVVGGVVAGGSVLSGGTATPALLTAAAAGTTARRKAVEGGVKALNNQRFLVGGGRKPGRDAGDVEDLLNRAYKNQIKVNAGKQPLHKFSKEELLDLEDIYGVMRSNLRGKRFTQGAVLGAFTQEQRMGTGIAFSDYVDQGMDSKQDAINSLVQGTAFGVVGVGSEALTAAATFRAFKRPGRLKKTRATDPFKFDPIPPGSMFKDFASISAVTSASEGLAELLQEELSVQQKFRIDKDYTQAQAKVDRVNALFAGVMGGLGVGGGLGAGTAVINKARNLSQRGAAEREMMRIFSDKEFQASIGAVMGERAGALETQFDFIKNENSGAKSVFVPIEAKAEFAKVQEKIEAMFGDNELFSVSTPIGAFFSTDQRAAGRLANIMDSGYKYDTGILEGFLAKELGFSRGRNPRDDIVVGLFDNEKGEFVKYQSAREDIKGDAEAAQAAMNKIRAAMDPKRYTVEIQSLAQHRKFRQEGLPKDADVLKATKEAFETSDMSEMGTSDDDAGVEGDRGTQNLDVTAANIDIRKNKVPPTQRAQFDAYLRDVYKLPINFSDLVFFIDQTPKFLNAIRAREKSKKSTPVLQSKDGARYRDIYGELINAEKNAGALSASDRNFIQNLTEGNSPGRMAGILNQLLDEIVEEGAQLQQSDSIESSLARDEFGSREVTNVPLVGVSEVLNRTNIELERPNPKDFKKGRKDKAYIKQLADFRAAQREAKAPIKEQDPVVMAKKGSGTVQNPFVDPKTDKGFEISKGDPKADGRSIAGLNTFIHPTLRAEFESQKPFLSKRAVQTFRDKAKLEREGTSQTGFLRFVDVRDLRGLRTATANNKSFTVPNRRLVLPNVPIVPRKFKGDKTMGGWASYNRKENKIFIDESELKKRFDAKAWTKPKVKGVDPLAADQFKTINEWRNFIVKHETAHSMFPRKDGETLAAYENRINQIATDEKTSIATGKEASTIQEIDPSTFAVIPKVIYKKGVAAVRKAETAGEGINVLRKAGNEHYGNPFTMLKTPTRADVKVDTLEEAVSRYTSWLEGTSDTDLQQERRQWIIDQIDSGALDNKNLLYYTEQTPNHAEALLRFSEQRSAPKTTPDQVGDFRATNRFVIVRMKPDPEQFREITRENVDTLRNIRADLQIRLDQAHARTRAGSYKTPIHFKLQNLNPEAKSKNPINIDMSVLLEGISTLSKIKQRRQPEEYTNQAAQRVASLLDAIDILQENNFKLEYYPLGVKEDAVFTMTGGKKKSDIELGAALDDIISQPDGPGASILRITMPKKFEGEFAQQVAYLRQQFGLPRLASGFFTNDRFAKVNIPLKELVYEAGPTPLTAGMNPAYIVPLIQNVEANTMQEMTLQELEDLAARAEDALSVRYAAVDKDSKKTPGEVKDLYGEVQAQDRTIMQFLNEIGKIIAAINSADIRNQPGTFDANFTRTTLQRDEEGDPTSKTVIQPRFVDVGGRIDKEVPIETYLDDLQTIAIERATPSIDETGMYNLDSPSDTQITDNSAMKMDIQDRNLFESYQEQQGKEFRGRDRYADLARAGNIKPTFKDNTKYQKVTAVYLGNVIQQKANKLRGIDTPAPTTRTRANLPFRKQIITNMIGAARNLGLTTNLHVIAAEEGYSDSQLPPRIKNAIDQKNFDTKRQNLLGQPDKVAMTLQYRDFDIILIKTNPNISEGQYYSAFLKELGNSLTFQELERSLKIPATRKKILQAYEQILKGNNVPPTYTNDDTGIENFMADQFSVAIRKELGVEVDGAVFDSMNKPTQAWFKRLAKSQKKMYDQSKIFKKRTGVDETFQEYAADLQQKLINPENQQVPYKTKASIETMIEGILGPETFTDKQLRKAMEQTSKLFKSKNLPTWLTKILLTSDTRLRNYGPIGEELANFFNLDPRTTSTSGRAGIFTLKTRRANAMFNDVAKLLGVEDGWIYSTLTVEQKQEIDLAADDTRDTASLPPRARAIREYLENNVYNDLGLSRYGVVQRQNFFPRVIAVAELAGNQELQIVARKLLEEANPEVSQAEIADSVNELVKKGSGELDFEATDEIDLGMMKERKRLWNKITNKKLIDAGVALPAEVALKQYLDKVALKYEFEQSGGIEKLNNLREKLTPEQQEDSKRIIDSMFGKTPPVDKGWLKTANNVLLPVNIITLLAFTVLASLQDTAGPVLRSRGTAKISDIASVIKTMIKDPQEAAELAREVGVIGVDAMSSFFIFAGEQNFMNQTAKNVSDTWFRVTLLEAYTKFTRVFATGMGTRFLQDNARKAQKGDSTAQLYLDELNVTADEVLAWEEGKSDDATRTKVNEALAQFVDESIVRPNPAQRPTYANDPRYALIWQLKSFFYAYGKTIVFPTLKESHRGFVNQGAGAGVMPLLLMAGILLPITMLGLEIRELTKYLLAELLPGIDGDDPGVNYFKTNSMGTGQYITEIIDRSGMLGPASLALPIFLESHRYGKPFWVSPLGPSAERVYDGITWDWNTADYLPVYGQLDTRNLGR